MSSTVTIDSVEVRSVPHGATGPGPLENDERRALAEACVATFQANRRMVETQIRAALAGGATCRDHAAFLVQTNDIRAIPVLGQIYEDAGRGSPPALLPGHVVVGVTETASIARALEGLGEANAAEHVRTPIGEEWAVAIVANGGVLGVRLRLLAGREGQ